MKKIISKVIVFVFSMAIILGNVAFAEDTTAPTITSSKKSGSVVEAGTIVIFEVNEEEDMLQHIFILDKDGKKVCKLEKENMCGNVDNAKIELEVVQTCDMYIEAIDTSDNSTGMLKFHYIVEDNEKPVISTSVPSKSVVKKGTDVKITVKDNDMLHAVTVKQVSGDKLNILEEKGLVDKVDTCFVTLTITETGNVYVEAEDVSGNTTGQIAFYYELEGDNEAPTITATPNSGKVNAGTTLTVVVKDNEVLKNITYSWNDGDEKTVLTNGKDAKGEKYDSYTLNFGKFPNQNTEIKLKIKATDMNGNKVEKTLNYTIVYADKTGPEVEMSESDGSTLPGGTKLELLVKDPESKVTSLTYQWYGASKKTVIPGVEEPANNVKVTNLTLGKEPGTYKFTVIAINSAGVETSKVFTYYVEGEKVEETDKIAPTVVANPSSGKIEPQEVIVLTAKDNEELKTLIYNWDNQSKITKNISGTEDNVSVTAPNTPGEHVLHVTVKDAEGNTVTKDFTYIVADKEKPTVVVSPNGGNVEPNEDVKITGKDNEGLDSITYNWDDKAPITKPVGGKEASIITEVPSTPGKHILHVTVKDEDGNKVSDEIEFAVADKEKPTVVVSPNGGNVEPNEDVKITGKDNEGLDSITYNWDDKAPITKPVGGKEASIITEVPSTPGKHILHVTVEDEDGNKVSDEIEFTVGDDEAPTITMNPKDKSTVKGGKIVKATLKDNVELKKVTYAWDDDDDTTKTLSGTSKTIELPKLPYKEGTYKIVITVEDNAGNKTTGKYTYYVEDDDDDEEYPTVDADPDGGEVEYGDKITITAEDEDGEIEYVEFYWDDDDDDTTKKYKDEFTVKVPSEKGKHYLYVRAMDDDNNLCDYERFTYTVKENKYPGNADIIGDINTKVKSLRVEIRNAEDKIRFEPEEEILYYVDYYNGTSSKVTNAKLVVDLPTYLEAEEASDKGSVTTKKITWNLGTLNAGEYGRVSFIAIYTSDKVNEKIITVPAKIYSGSSLKDTSTVRNMIFSVGASGTGNHEAYCVGYPEGTFRAEGKITRAELAAMVANIEGITASYRGQYSDVNNHWAANYIQAVLDRGYMKPNSYSTFGAQAYATRADLAYAIAAILDVHELEPIFVSATDTKNNDARCAVEQLLRLGIMDGYSDGTAKPNSNITRAEAVTIINNYLFRGELYTKGYNYSYNYENNYNHGGSYYILKFTDLSSNHWAYGHIMDATNNHRYQRVMDGNEEML